MFNAWTFVRFVHVLAAAIWVGGLIALSGLVIPMVMKRLPEAEARPLVRTAGKRFGMILVALLLPIQLVTGLALLWHRNINVATMMQIPYGKIFTAKMFVLVAVVAAAALHGVASARGQKTLSRVIALATLVGSAVIVLLATALATT